MGRAGLITNSNTQAHKKPAVNWLPAPNGLMYHSEENVHSDTKPHFMRMHFHACFVHALSTRCPHSRVQSPPIRALGKSVKLRKELGRRRGPSDGPILSRKQKSKARADAYHSQKAAEVRVEQCDDPKGAAETRQDDGGRGFAGSSKMGEGTGKPLIEIDLRNGGAVSVYDANGVKAVHRARFPADSTINNACVEASNICKKMMAKHTPKHLWGTKFTPYIFSLHRGSVKTPRMSRTVNKHRATYELLKKFIFEAEFPKLYKRYKETVDTVAANVKGTEAAFYPFASFCINIPTERGVICTAHIDLQNLGPGLCVVIPFGEFDAATDCKLVVWELGYKFQVAAGQLIFFPSALYTHYNTKLLSMGMRGSLVGWTGASVFQWVDLSCRAVNQLSPKEFEDYKAGLKERVRRGFELFPQKI
ncbi:hypothetical protein C8R43DRAFT_951133 [Mycena crocata]|nr:hypothetical protein C8R43DRAFT_951133 [Mycena crocata]